MPGPNLGLDEQTQGLLNQLLGNLETPQVTPPRRPGIGETALGAVADALGARANIAAGGQAPALGPFAAEQMANRQQFDEQVRQVERAKADLKNQAALESFRGKIRLKQEQIQQAGQTDRKKIQEASELAKAQEITKRQEEDDIRNAKLEAAKLGIEDFPDNATYDDILTKIAQKSESAAITKLAPGRELGEVTRDRFGRVLHYKTQPIGGGKPPDMNEMIKLAKESGDPDAIEQLARSKKFDDPTVELLRSVASARAPEVRLEAGVDMLTNFIRDVEDRISAAEEDPQAAPPARNEQIAANLKREVIKMVTGKKRPTLQEINAKYRSLLSQINAGTEPNEEGEAAITKDQAAAFATILRSDFMAVFGDVLVDVGVDLGPEPQVQPITVNVPGSP